MGLQEIAEASQVITQASDPDANIIFGATVDERMGSNIKISVIATGFDENRFKYGAGFMRRSFGAYGGQAQDTGRQSFSSAPTPAAPPVQQQYTPSQPVSVFSSAPASVPNGFSPVTPAAPVQDDSQNKKDELDDEFDIPAFLRQGR